VICQLQKLDEGQKVMEILVKSTLTKRQVVFLEKEVLSSWEQLGISCGAMRGILEKAATTGLDDCEKEMVLRMLELTKQKKRRRPAGYETKDLPDPGGTTCL
jgi:malate synthase